MYYVIRNKFSNYLFWSNEHGWVNSEDESDYLILTEDEALEVDLPIEGELISWRNY